MNHHDIVIVGAGAGGVGVANALMALDPELDVAVIEPADFVHYEPLRPVVAAGLVAPSTLRRPIEDVLSSGVTRVRDSVVAVEPDVQRLALADGAPLSYGYLVLATGRTADWGAIQGLEDGPTGAVVCGARSGNSNAAVTHGGDGAALVDVSRQLRGLRGGRALFVSCSDKRDSATWSAALLANDAARRSDKSGANVSLITAATVDPDSRAEQALVRCAIRNNVTVAAGYTLSAVRVDDQVAVFTCSDTGRHIEQSFDLLHVSPPTTGAPCLSESGLIDDDGRVTVDPKSLQHVAYPTVFALGSASNLPCADGPFASATQAGIVAGNLRACIYKTRMRCAYNGHTSEPVVTGKGRSILVESTYDGETDASFPFDQTVERRSLFDFAMRGSPERFWNAIARSA